MLRMIFILIMLWTLLIVFRELIGEQYTLSIMLWIAIIVTALLVAGSVYRKRLRQKQWLASQPPDVLISGRVKAAEMARALLKDQIDYDNFIDEIGQSQDPEIKHLLSLLSDLVEHEPYENDRLSHKIERQICRMEDAKEENRGSTPS
jgi:hypothetical protein